MPPSCTIYGTFHTSAVQEDVDSLRWVCRVPKWLGHRQDVCPNVTICICPKCGTPDPPEDHSCTPTCITCNGTHETGSSECRLRYKPRTPPPAPPETKLTLLARNNIQASNQHPGQEKPQSSSGRKNSATVAQVQSSKQALPPPTSRNETVFRRTLDYIGLRHKYGQPAINGIRQFLSASTRLAAFNMHLRFKLTCKSKQLIPKSLRLKHPVKSAFSHQVISRAERQLLQARIEDCTRTVKNLERRVFFATRQLEFIMPEVVPEIHLVANQETRRRMEKQEVSQERKLNALLEKGLKQSAPSFEVRNMSSYMLTTAEEKVLGRGLNFNQGKQPDTW
ncbi:hypothetical protein HPB49_008660 [Dermacentor silvarum]|uniref:Uncharacterized protein n=1 Tax=Dermacentor silvarum TaxID=543639 RepID=A0ACB8CK10_DERSI|nr:hypothetical protein HPB49_008660 [Dermacentor silvarum]